MATHNELGKWGEDYAEEYLASKGYSILHRDWRIGKRDIDIIAKNAEGNILVFVEVRTRSYDEVMDPIATIDRKKAKSIGIAANAFIKQYNVMDEVRFDIVGITKKENGEIIMNHIIDAFNPCLL